MNSQLAQQRMQPAGGQEHQPDERHEREAVGPAADELCVCVCKAQDLVVSALIVAGIGSCSLLRARWLGLPIDIERSRYLTRTRMVWINACTGNDSYGSLPLSRSGE